MGIKPPGRHSFLGHLSCSVLILDHLQAPTGKHLDFTPLCYNRSRMSIQNLQSYDPFADAARGTDDGVQDGLVHIRIQQRNGRKTLTTVQGLSADYDLKKIVRACKKEFACNGTVVEHSEYGEVLQLQGDQRENICQFLTKVGLVKAEQIKVHGF